MVTKAKKCRIPCLFQHFFALLLVEIYVHPFLITTTDVQTNVCWVRRFSYWKGIESMAKAAAKKKPPSKTEVFTSISEKTELTKKQVTAVFEALSEEIARNLGKKGPGVFQIPNLCKIVAVSKPALPKRQVRNPATGEMIWADPKPASVAVRVRPLKKLKEMVAK